MNIGNKKLRKPKILYQSVEEEELWTIKTLPEKKCEEDKEEPSQVVNDIIKHQEQQDKILIIEFGDKLDEINKEIETDIRLKSTSLKEELLLLKTNGFDSVQNLESCITELVDFDEKNFIEVKSICSDIMKTGNTKIHDFIEDLQSLESDRSDNYKLILRECYNKALIYSFKCPYDIQTYFEEKLLSLNQMILSNLKNYKELQLHLLLVFNDEIKQMFYNIAKYEEEWQENCKTEIVRRLKEFDLKEEEIEEILFKNKEISKVIQLFNEKIDTLLREYTNITAFNEGAAEEWYKKTSQAVENLDMSAKQLINLYQISAEELCHSFYKDSEEFTLRLLKLGIVCENEVDKYNADIVKPEFDNAKSSIHSEVLLVEDMWKETIQNMLQITYAKFIQLKDLDGIWQNRTTRISDLQNLVLLSIKEAAIKNDSIFHEKLEVNLNVQIDTLRQEPAEPKLKKSLKKTLKMLDTTKSTIISHKQNELKLLDKYYDYVYNETEILVCELKKFLIDESADGEFLDVKNELEKHNSLLFNKLKECEKHIMEINCWKDSIRNSVEEYVDTCETDQSAEAEKWISEEEQVIVKKYDTKLELHEQRYERIEKEIYEVRLAELRKHKQMFTEHNKSVENALAKMHESLKKFDESQKSKAENLEMELENMTVDRDKCNNADKTNEFLNSYKRFVSEKSGQLKQNFINIRTKFTTKIDKLLKANYEFLSQIKLFSEGGNFHAKEVSGYSKSIQKLEKFIEQKSANLHATLYEMEIYLNREVDDINFEHMEIAQHMHLSFNFQDNTANVFTNIRSLIKNIVYDMKFQKKKIDNMYAEIRKRAGVNLDDFSNVQFVFKYTKELISLCHQFRYYLEEAEFPCKLQPTTPSTQEMQKTANTTYVSTIHSKRTDKSERSFKKYRNLLFDREPSDEKKFMPVICSNLFRTLSEMATLASSYYSENIRIKRDEIIANGYDEFMIRLLYKLQYYYLQCGHAWILIIQEFCDQTDLFINFVDQYTTNYLFHIHKTAEDDLIGGFKKVFNHITNVINNCKDDIGKVEKQLKPLHGYPGNSNLLNELQNKMTEVIGQSQNTFNDSIDPFEEEQKKHYVEYQSKISDAAAQVDDLRSHMFNKIFYEKLLANADNFIAFMNTENYAQEMSQNSFQMKLERSMVSLQATSSQQTFVEFVPVVALQEIQFEINEKKLKLYEMRTSFYDYLVEAQKIWNNSVQSVLNLYTVKYE